MRHERRKTTCSDGVSPCASPSPAENAKSPQATQPTEADSSLRCRASHIRRQVRPIDLEQASENELGRGGSVRGAGVLCPPAEQAMNRPAQLLNVFAREGDNSGCPFDNVPPESIERAHELPSSERYKDVRAASRGLDHYARAATHPPPTVHRPLNSAYHSSPARTPLWRGRQDPCRTSPHVRTAVM
jgi:hypothetical protein